MKLSSDEIKILQGLLLAGHTYVGASDYVHVPRLSEYGLVQTWMTMGGFPAWRLTEEGVKYAKGE